MKETTYYHGSEAALKVGDSLQTPTGMSCMDVTGGGVVYLTDTPEASSRYGTVYAVEAIGAVSYAVQRAAQRLTKKKGRYTRGVWVALPENTRIMRKIR